MIFSFDNQRGLYNFFAVRCKNRPGDLYAIERCNFRCLTNKHKVTPYGYSFN